MEALKHAIIAHGDADTTLCGAKSDHSNATRRLLKAESAFKRTKADLDEQLQRALRAAKAREL